MMQSDGSNGDVEGAVEALNVMGGWRALFVLSFNAVDLDSLIRALPWVENGVPKVGSFMRRLEVGDLDVVVMGGILSDKEGEALFDIHAQVKDLAKQVFIVPPANAPKALIMRMYDEGVAPRIPVAEALPNPRLWTALTVSFVIVWLGLFFTNCGTSSGRRAIEDLRGVVFLQVNLLLIITACWIMRMRRQRQRDRLLQDPARLATTAWAATLPPRPVQH